MAANQALLERVRDALSGDRDVAEKRMFGGITFMLCGKMCVSVGATRLMCRIDPAIHDRAIKRRGCRTVEMKRRAYRGYVYVDADAIRLKKNFDYWIGLAREFNVEAKSR